MAQHNDREEATFGKAKTPQQIASQLRLQHTNAQVDEVVGIMGKNVNNVLERDEKLSELDDRATTLKEGASRFEKQASTLKWRAGMKNMKVWIFIGFIAFVCLLVTGYKFDLF